MENVNKIEIEKISRISKFVSILITMTMWGYEEEISVWQSLCDVHSDGVCGLNTSNSCWVLPLTLNTSVTIITNFRTHLMAQTRHIISKKKKILFFLCLASLKSVMTSLLFWEILSFCLALSRLVRRDGAGVRGNISFGFTFFYGRPVIFWHRNDWMSKYLYKAQTDLFKFTLNLNCNNELFKMFFFSHNNNTPITDYSSVLRKTELYKQFFKRGNSRSPLARLTKKENVRYLLEFLRILRFTQTKCC